MSESLDKAYNPTAVQDEIAKLWNQKRAFHAVPDPAKDPYVIVIPPPNVTAALHMGHALNNTLQDILIRHHRMLGENTVWMPGTDHAGIATQTVVEKRVLKEEGKRRTDFQRDEFVAKIQKWKDEYEATITGQLKAMGCSCDWERQRFTMDPVCAAAVREAFFRLFKDGLIYRGKRLVNWDPVTLTALADDEVENQEIDGHFYYLRYPLEDGSGHVTVATTRPETMLGDTAVAINPKDPRAAGLRGKRVKLPIVNRMIPIVEDDYVVMPVQYGGDPSDAKATMATGFLKVTPAHDVNDYEIGRRHNLPVINVMAPDASISDKHGWTDVGEAGFLLGKSREEARKLVVAWFKERGLLEDVKPYRHSVGHSYRSHVPIEPYQSDQWYVKVTDDRLSGAALRAMAAEQKTGSDAATERRSDGGWEGTLRFYPERYARTFQTWHENIRDWCISRQLWWGHRIPVWTVIFNSAHSVGVGELNSRERHYRECIESLLSFLNACGVVASDVAITPAEGLIDGQRAHYVCSRNARADVALALLDRIRQHRPNSDRHLAANNYQHLQAEFGDAAKTAIDGNLQMLRHCSQDPDVLDTWFSSGLWPISTLGWPNPEAFPKEIPEGAKALNTWNPGSVLCTAREIITLWVSRMVMFNLYFRDSLPFHDVFIHAMIQDGEGRKMSKSLGNGVDPLDIIHSHGADAMRFTLAMMTTNTQDVRMPVEKDPASGRNTSPKFDIGRNFCNKLWNAGRFVLSKISGPERSGSVSRGSRSIADRWIISRLGRTIGEVNRALKEYQFNAYGQALYDFFWRDYCDWYLEAIKPVVNNADAAGESARATLAACLDATLRMLHPVTPFITERLWAELNKLTSNRSVEDVDLPASELCIHAPWPEAPGSVDARVESMFELLQQVVGAVRNIRNEYSVPPKQATKIRLRASDVNTVLLSEARGLIERLGNSELTAVGPSVTGTSDAATAIVGDVEVFVEGLIDPDAERTRLSKRAEELSKGIKSMEGRLSNAGYIAKAPPQLVEQTRQELAEKQRELATIESKLAALK
jgi:valyl-tRNA synthetase